jgi:PPM family protein phosphatase
MSRRILEYSAATNVGRRRDNNEDTYLSLPEQGLWLVADGMGGHEAGEVASAIVRDTLLNQSYRNLSEAIQNSHRAVVKAAAEGQGAPGMGSTVVALRSRDYHYEVAWVGDSRAYLWTHTPEGGRLERLTTDHSYVQMLLASGAIGEEEVDNHPEKNIITQCLGSSELPEVQVDAVQGQWLPGQWILLCSDGLTDELDDQHIARILCDSRQNHRRALQLLMRAALARGGRDNITLQVVQSPLTPNSRWSILWQWIPTITGRRTWDAGLYGAALVSLTLMLYWILG